MIQNRRDLYKRVKLSECLPLKTPFTIYVDPSSACNFKCNFCYHSLDDSKLKEIGFEKKIMDMPLFERCIDSIKEFPDKIKMLSLFFKGEPFLNKQLPEMIKYARNADVAEKIYITTNGTLFSPELNHNIIAAGLDEVLVSIEALNSEDYKTITGTEVDFEELVYNIKHFNANKKQCKFFIKTVTYGEDTEKEKRFHQIFDEICDFAYVEKVVPVFDRVDYSDIKVEPMTLNKFGKPIHVCTRLFFSMCIHSNGIVSPCLVDYVPEIVLGNVRDDKLTDIWNGSAFNEIRAMHLKKSRYGHGVCGKCGSPDYDSQAADLLDDDAERLLELYRPERRGGY